jgi:hypothetical protein
VRDRRDRHVTDLAADNIAMMLAFSTPHTDEEDTHELFALKLKVALQSCWGNVIRFHS